MSQKLDALLESMAALPYKMQILSGHVDADEEREKDAEMPPVSHRPAHATRRRASPMGSQHPDQEMAEEVRKRVIKRMRQLSTLPGTPGEEDSSTGDEDEPALGCRRKMLKSGHVSTSVHVWIYPSNG